MQMQAAQQIKQIIGQNLRAKRESLDWSRARLAREVAELGTDVDALSIYKWERGLHRPSDAVLPAVCAALGIEYGWLLTEHKRKKAAA